MSLETIMWLWTAAALVALLEIYVMRRRGWSDSYSEPATATRWLLVVAIVVACGSYTAFSASTLPHIAFGAALALLVAALFQFIPWLRHPEWRYAPGLASTLLLLGPLSVAAIWRAVADGNLTAGGLLDDLIFLAAAFYGSWRVTKKTWQSVRKPDMPPGPFGD